MEKIDPFIWQYCSVCHATTPHFHDDDRFECIELHGLWHDDWILQEREKRGYDDYNCN